MLHRALIAFVALIVIPALTIPSLVLATGAPLTRELLAHCIGCDMHGSDLRGMDLHGIAIVGADMRDVNLSGADLRNVNFVGVDLAGANLQSARVAGATFTGCDLSRAGLNNADLRRADMPGTMFHAAVMPGATLTGATLSGVDFSAADLRRVNFSAAWICGQGDRDARPWCIDLNGADVTGAVFRGARWCRNSSSDCRDVTVDELRRYGKSPLTGALF